MDSPDGEKRVARLEQAMFGFSGENGVYGDIRELRNELRAGLQKQEDRMSGLYKLLAVTALSVLGSGLGVVVTLITTGGK